MAKEFVYSKTFQLTPSRRATKFLKESKPFLFISTHALTEGDIHLRSFARKCRISTHALTEGDQNSTESGMHGEDFNSRPHGGRLVGGFESYLSRNISTHALTEGD